MSREELHRLIVEAMSMAHDVGHVLYSRHDVRVVVRAALNGQPVPPDLADNNSLLNIHATVEMLSQGLSLKSET